MADSRLAGYRLERQIGVGPVGVVFYAVDELRGQAVALKIIGLPLAADQGFASRLLQQAQAAAALGEPHIMPVFQAGQADGLLFVAMPYLDGADARSLLRREGALPPGRAVSIVSQVASALDAAHAAGLVHGDVKLGNILVWAPPGQPERVHLSDFGQGRTRPSPMLAGSWQASEALDCIAPEQLEGEQAEGPADQYALACVAFELLTGVAPFRHDELDAPPPDTSQPPRATSAQPGLPPAVDSVLGKALAPVPADRYTSCSEFANALGGAFWAQPSPGMYAARMPTAPVSVGAGPVVADPPGQASPLQARPPQESRSQSHPPISGSEPWLIPPRRRRRLRPVAFAGLAVAVVAALVIGLVVGLRGHGGGLSKPTAFRIAAQSATMPENGDVWIVFHDTKRSTARIDGSLRGVSRGETARLYAQPFPFRRRPSPAGPPVTLHPAGPAKTASYSFQVTPARATRYHVEVFSSRLASSPLARSAVTTVYVTGGWRPLRDAGPCNRPVCSETVSGEVLLPPSALSTEMAKPERPYFGLSLAKSANAVAPATLQLGGGDAHVTTKPLSADAYEVIITFTFSVGKVGNYSWLWTVCLPDTEAQDGVGLPGHQLCGDQTIPARENYLGVI